MTRGEIPRYASTAVVVILVSSACGKRSPQALPISDLPSAALDTARAPDLVADSTASPSDAVFQDSDGTRDVFETYAGAADYICHHPDCLRDSEDPADVGLSDSESTDASADSLRMDSFHDVPQPFGGDTCGPCAENQVCWASGVCAPSRGGPCGEIQGLENGAVWPAFGYCSTQQRRSPYVGPQLDPFVEWTVTVGRFIHSSPPVVARDGTVYAGGNDDTLYAIAPDGSESWRFEADGYVNTPAIASDGTIYASIHGHPSLIALAPDGTELWSAGSDSTNGASPPAIARDGTIYIASQSSSFTGCRLHRFTSDGEEIWSSDIGCSAYQPMALAPDGTAYKPANNPDTALFAVSPDGDIMWVLQLDCYMAVPAIAADGTVYLGTVDGHLYAIDPGGSVKWTYELVGGRYDDPALGPDGTIYIGSADGHLHAVYPDGTRRWTLQMPRRPESPTVDALGRIFLGWGRDALGPQSVWAVRPNGTKEFEIPIGDWATAHHVVVGGQGVLYFILADGTLFRVGDKNTIDRTPTPRPGF